jgi:hypothetical protein
VAGPRCLGCEPSKNSTKNAHKYGSLAANGWAQTGGGIKPPPPTRAAEHHLQFQKKKKKDLEIQCGEMFMRIYRCKCTLANV